MITTLLALLSTIAASVIHGGDYLRFKVVVMALHTLAIAGALWVGGVTSYELLVTFPITAAYWFLFRTGKQAKAELDALAGIGKLSAVWKAYLIPCATCATLSIIPLVMAKAWVMIPLAALPFAFLWIPPLACKLFPYGAAVWPDTEANRKIQRKQRMKVEALVGFAPAGLSIAILVWCAGRAFA
jgi:hypothetical protein